jgi:glucokinase
MTKIYAGVDLGGTNTACALASEDGKIFRERTIPTLSHEGPEAVLDRIACLLTELASDAAGKLEAVGIGVPGLVDREKGITLFLPNLPTQWRGVPAAAVLKEKIGCPVFLLNDVRAATLGELVFGLGRDVKTMVFFAIGTGIGGGIVVDGGLRLGPLGAAGELGHQTILPDGPLCGCGSRGCLEALASGPAIAAEGVRLLRSGLAPRLYELVGGQAGNVTPKEMTAAAEAGDEAVRQAIVRAADYLGIGVANLVNALHPELVVLGGGVAAIGPLLLDTVRCTVRDRVRMFPVDGVRIECSILEDKAGLHGGVALAMRQGRL